MSFTKENFLSIFQPRNVLVDIRGTLKLADFGVSKIMSEDESTIYQTSAMGK